MLVQLLKYGIIGIAGGVVYWLCGLLGANSIVQWVACALTVILLCVMAAKLNWTLPALRQRRREKNN